MVPAYGRSAQLDGCTFHQLVDLKEFEERRILSICPPAGQVVTCRLVGHTLLHLSVLSSAPCWRSLLHGVTAVNGKPDRGSMRGPVSLNGIKKMTLVCCSTQALACGVCVPCVYLHVEFVYLVFTCTWSLCTLCLLACGVCVPCIYLHAR